MSLSMEWGLKLYEPADRSFAADEEGDRSVLP